MKRKAADVKAEFPTLRKIFPLFWKKCGKCKDSFRLEWGWSAMTGPYLNGLPADRYLCKECAPDWEQANRYFVNGDYIPERPEPPFPRIQMPPVKPPKKRRA